jgi:hypothetical protein
MIADRIQREVLVEAPLEVVWSTGAREERAGPPPAVAK